MPSRTISSEHATLIRSLFTVLEPNAQRLLDCFGEHLLRDAPHVRAIFPDEFSSQRDFFMASISLLVKHAQRLHEIEQLIVDLGARNAADGLEQEHYRCIRDALVQSLAQVAGELWYSDLEQAWSSVFNAVIDMMLQGARQQAGRRAA